MENRIKPPQTQKAVITDGELIALVELAGIRPGKASPLAQITGKAVPAGALGKLQPAGLVDSANRPTAAAQECLNILANPGTEIDLLWGNPDGINLTKAYASAGKERLIAFTRAEGNSQIAYFLSPQDITDLIVEKTARPAVAKEVALSIECGTAAAPVFFALLDMYRENQLKASLERRHEFEVRVVPEDALRLLQEAKVDNNLDWYAPVAAMVMPNDAPLTESSINEGISAMKKQGILGADGTASDTLASFASRAFPLTAFFGVTAYTIGDATEKAPFALLRGLETLLFAQVVQESGQSPQMIINSIPTSRLPELLLNLSLRPFAASAATRDRHGKSCRNEILHQMRYEERRRNQILHQMRSGAHGIHHGEILRQVRNRR